MTIPEEISEPIDTRPGAISHQDPNFYRKPRAKHPARPRTHNNLPPGLLPLALILAGAALILLAQIFRR